MSTVPGRDGDPPAAGSGRATTVGPALESATVRLGLAGIPEPRREARALLRLSLGGRPAREFDRAAALAADEEARFRQLVARRLCREPVAYLRREREFFGLAFEVGPGVLVPRPETELLVEQGLIHLRAQGPEAPRVVDMGTGSGCIAVALAVVEPRTRIVGLDCSAAALAFARRNVRRHGVGDRVRCLRGSFLTRGWLARLPAGWLGGTDLVVANPPYVMAAEYRRLPPEVRCWEPRVALRAEGGFRAGLRRLAVSAAACLRPGGLLAVEVGWRQAPGACDVLAALGFTDVRTVHDLAGIDRVVCARHTAGPVVATGGRRR